MNFILKMAWRDTRASRRRLLLFSLAIVLGVTFISGTFILTDTLQNTFTTLFGNIYANIDFQVRGVAQLGSGAGATRNELPESLLATVRRDNMEARGQTWPEADEEAFKAPIREQ